MVNKIAIDVVLLPPKNIMEDAIELNKKIIKNSSHEVKLDKKNCVPHISLAIGCVEEENLSNIEEILNEIAKEFLPIKLKISKIKSTSKLSSFEIKRTEKLQKLHELIIGKLKSYFSFEANSEMFYTPPKVNELTFYWMKNFAGTSILEKYSPHITLGYGEIGEKEYSPKEFISSELAVYQLGNYFTCRKVLLSL